MLLRSSLPVTVPLFLSLLIQAQNTTSDSLPTFKSSVRVVPVDVVVTNSKGEPVTGLHQEDFQILEQGKPQRISSFHEYTGAPPVAAAPSSLPRNVFTNRAEEPPGEAVTVLLLDSLNTPLSNQLLVHQQVLKYFHSMKPRTPIAMFKLSSELRLLQSFTSDYSLIQAELVDKKFGTWPQPSTWLRTPADWNTGQQAVALAPPPRGRTPMNGTRQFEAESAASQVDMRVQLTFDAFQQLAQYLAAVPGRKNVVWFSRSFPLIILPPGAQANNVDILRNYNPKLQKLSSQLTKAQIALYPIAAEGLRAPFDDDSVNDPALADPQISGVQADFLADDAIHLSMDSFAELTGGRAAYNTNGLAEAMDNAVRHGTHYYALSYSPTNKKEDGSFRSIHVKVGQNDYRLDYRRGYYADKGKSLKSEAREQKHTPLDALMARGLPDATQITYEMLLQVSDHQPISAKDRAGENVSLKSPVTRYTAVVRIPAQDVRLTTSPDGSRHGALEMDLVAYDRGGNPLNWLRKSIQIETRPEAASRTKDIVFMQDIDIPQGDVYVRSGIYDPASNKAGTIEVPLSKVVLAKAN